MDIVSSFIDPSSLFDDPFSFNDPSLMENDDLLNLASPMTPGSPGASRQLLVTPRPCTTSAQASDPCPSYPLTPLPDKPRSEQMTGSQGRRNRPSKTQPNAVAPSRQMARPKAPGAGKSRSLLPDQSAVTSTARAPLADKSNFQMFSEGVNDMHVGSAPSDSGPEPESEPVQQAQEEPAKKTSRTKRVEELERARQARQSTVLMPEAITDLDLDDAIDPQQITTLLKLTALHMIPQGVSRHKITKPNAFVNLARRPYDHNIYEECFLCDTHFGSEIEMRAHYMAHTTDAKKTPGPEVILFRQCHQIGLLALSGLLPTEASQLSLFQIGNGLEDRYIAAHRAHKRNATTAAEGQGRDTLCLDEIAARPPAAKRQRKQKQSTEQNS